MKTINILVKICPYNSNRTTQDEIFSVGVKDIVESVLNGYNGSIIASGQTGRQVTRNIEVDIG